MGPLVQAPGNPSDQSYPAWSPGQLHKSEILSSLSCLGVKAARACPSLRVTARSQATQADTASPEFQAKQGGERLGFSTVGPGPRCGYAVGASWSGGAQARPRAGSGGAGHTKALSLRTGKRATSQSQLASSPTRKAMPARGKTI